MIVSRNLHNQSLKSLSSLLHFCSPNAVIPRDFGPKALSSYVGRRSNPGEDEGLSFSRSTELGQCVSWVRRMSSATPRGRSMRSKVERRMRMESGKTMREIRRAKKIQKKLMTENERLVYNLKRAKKKVSVLLQKLKKYELPDLPPPVHDPEILTPEQLQAFRKIGFRNKNYVPVGVRGVFGGVVQNMHMHWKFHETVQVCCDNFPKEKIKEMASMIARLSGGIVINVHNGKTIIMYRGRNYRQPKNLIPINTLTKRKALFKARFEQALESQKLNIKKIEQQLRRSGINPEDPAATASIQRVAASFFNAIDSREGSPYVFRQPDSLSSSSATVSDINFEASEPSDEREQAELDRFIADIEDAAEREWAAEEAAEKEDLGRIRYWNRPEFDGRFRRSDGGGDEIRRPRIGQQRRGDDRDDDSDINDDDDDDDGDDDDSDSDSVRNKGRFKRNGPPNSRKSSASVVEEESEALSDIENAMWGSDDSDDRDCDSRSSRVSNHNYRAESESEEESYRSNRQSRRMASYESSSDDNSADKSRVTSWQKHNKTGAEFDSGESCSESEDSGWRRMATSPGSAGSHDEDDYEDDYENESYRAERVSDVRTRRKNDETWDSDGDNDSDSE